MTTNRLLHAALAAGLLLVAPAIARAQGTGLVSVSDPAYADLDRLLALGLLDSVVVGQRPYSAAQVARLTGIAHRRLAERAGTEAGDQAVAGEALARLDASFGGTAALWLDDARLVASSTDARRRPLLGANGPFAEASIDPLARRRLGVPAATGQSVSLEAAQRVEATTWLAFRAAARVETGSYFDKSTPDPRAELLLLNARARWRNVALTVGREQFTWSQRAGDGLFLASDAPALDQVNLASERPFALPGVLRHAGPASGTLVVADLGPSVARSHSRLVAYKLSLQPVRTVELGFQFMNHFGGAGARTSSAGNRLIDLLPFIDIFRTHNYTDSTRTLDVESDKSVGADLRLTFPQLGGLVVAGDWLIDDFDATRLSAVFTNDASHSLALLFPRVGSPRVSLELSAKHMGIYTSTHAALVNGMTSRGRLLGDELGPDAKAFGAVLRWQPAAGVDLALDARSAVWSDVAYFGNYTARNVWEVYKLSSRPNEQRERLLVSAGRRSPQGMELFARAGAERIRGARRFYGNRTDYVAEVGLALLRRPL